LQIFRVGQPWMPDHRLPVHGEFNRQVIWREPSARAGCVGEHERAGVDFERVAIAGDGACELGHREPAIEKDERSVILKVAVRRPFHADQFRGKHGKSRIAQYHRSLGIGHWVGDVSGRLRGLSGLASRSLCG
jgi:hypothetical protein